MSSVCVYGGGDRAAQIKNISTGVEIIIATPGRLNDLVEAKVIDVHTITYLVLDEGKLITELTESIESTIIFQFVCFISHSHL